MKWLLEMLHQNNKIKERIKFENEKSLTSNYRCGRYSKCKIFISKAHIALIMLLFLRNTKYNIYIYIIKFMFVLLFKQNSGIVVWIFIHNSYQPAARLSTGPAGPEQAARAPRRWPAGRANIPNTVTNKTPTSKYPDTASDAHLVEVEDGLVVRAHGTGQRGAHEEEAACTPRPVNSQGGAVILAQL